MEPIKNGLKCWLEGADVTNSSTIWKDRSGNNNNFSITGSLTTENNMAVFSGSQYAKISNLNIEHGTIEITVAYDSGGTSSHGFGSWESNKYKFTFGSYSIHMRKKSNPVSGAGSWDFRISQNIKYGDVATYGLSYNESTFSIFYNGKIISEGVSSEIPNITSFYLGLKSDDNTKHAGKIKSLRIYNRKLEYHEILANYQYELLDRNNNLYVNDNNLPKIVEKLSDASNIKITGNKYGNRVQTVIDKIVEKADNVTKAINQEVVNNTHSFKTGTGNNINVSSDVQDSFSEIAIKGQTYQNLYPKLNANNYQNKTGAIQFDRDIIKFVANGAYQNIFLKKESLIVKSSTTYTLVIDVLKNTIVNTQSDSMLYLLDTAASNNKELTYFNEQIVLKKNTAIGRYKFKVTTKSDLSVASYASRCFLTIAATSGELWIKYSLIEGDHTNNPNLPSYFEGIVGVGDKSKNLFNPKKATHGYLTTDGTISNATTNIRTDYIEIKSNTPYIGQAQGDSTLNNYSWFDSDKNFIKRDSRNDSVISPTNAKYLIYHNAYAPTGSTANISKAIIQIEEGEKPTQYEPYYDGYKMQVKSNGKNLVNPLIPYPFSIKKSSINDGTLLDVVKVKPNTIYTMSVNRTENKGRIIAKFSNRLIHSSEVSSYNQGHVYNFLRDNYANGRQFEYSINSGDKITFTTLDDCNYIYLNIDGAHGTFNAGDFVTTINSVQIEESAIATSYELYKQDNLQLLLDQPLMKLPNGVYDEITKDGKLIRRIGKIVLNGSENWYAAGALDQTKKYFTANNLINNMKQIINSKFDDQISNNLLIDNPYSYPTKSCIWALWQDQVSKIRISVSNIQDVDGIKAWLKQNQTTLYYELQNPIIKDLSNNQIKLFKDGHLTFNTVVAPESSHIVQLNKSAQIQNTIKQSQLLDNKITVLENNYDSLMLSTMSTLNDLELDYTLK